MPDQYAKPTTRDVIYRQLIVTLPETPGARIRLRKALEGVDYIEREFIEQIHAQLIELAEHEDLAAIAARLVQEEVAEAAEQNRVFQGSAVVNDPLYPEQWALERMGAEGAWLRARKVINPSVLGVVVAVADSGIRTDHPDLVTHLWDDGAGHHGLNLLDGSFDVYDGDGHGTKLAGTIGARSNDWIGIAAAEWPIRLMAIKFTDVTHPPNAWTGALAIITAALAGAEIINAAWGVGIPYVALKNAIAFAGAWKQGVLVVAAAGNDGLDNDMLPTYPASYSALSNLISVMASNRYDDKPGFSNYGATKVHLAAPGVGVLSTDTYLGVERWRTFSGTSAACACVSNAAALIKAMNPTWRPAQIRDHLVASVEPSRWLKCVARGRLSLERAVLGPFVITSPIAGDVWAINGNPTVTWTNRYPTGVPTTTVTLEISKNGGPYMVLEAGKPNIGASPVVAPNTAVVAARLRLRSDQAPNFYAESSVFKVQ